MTVASRLLLVVSLAFTTASAAADVTTPLQPASFDDLARQYRSAPVDVDAFRVRGPFAVTTQPNVPLRLNLSQQLTGDLYLAGAPDKAPLVILVHGYGNTRAHHAAQAQHLASWGVHSLALQVPNKGPWVANGRMLARLTDALRRRPERLDGRVDASRIVLAGHSFGAASVTVALADRAPAIGAVLLDPAYMDRAVPGYMRRVAKPVLIIGGDEENGVARNRDAFRATIPTAYGEVSVRDAVHEDAEYPLDPALAAEGQTVEHQMTFAAALTVAAVSLATTGQFEAAWHSLNAGEKNSRFFSPRKN